MQNKENEITQEVVADKMLWPLWRCVQDDYKDKYKKDVWEHFENALKSASFTGSLKVFLTNFQKRIPCDLQSQYTKDIICIIESKKDSQVLNWIRTEATYLVMLVRIRNQERKELNALKNS